MERTLALQNALGVLCYINTLHPELLSTFSNYKAVYIVDVYANPKEFSVYGLSKRIKNGLMKGAEMEINYIESIDKEILKITWRHNGEEKK